MHKNSVLGRAELLGPEVIALAVCKGAQDSLLPM